MGLDMYLYARKYLSDYDFIKDGVREEFAAVKKASGMDRVDELAAEHGPIGRQAFVTVCVAYWRKANSVHGWFVRECAMGKDDCSEIDVPRESLSRLAKICEHLVSSKDEKLAGEILPPTPGFFFGSYEIDEMYWNDMSDTVAMINGVLSKFPESDDEHVAFTYRASW